MRARQNLRASMRAHFILRASDARLQNRARIDARMDKRAQVSHFLRSTRCKSALFTF
jgi:hypothetical protein